MYCLRYPRRPGFFNVQLNTKCAAPIEILCSSKSIELNKVNKNVKMNDVFVEYLSDRGGSVSLGCLGQSI